ncbi:MAG: hypothetical protein ACRDPH_13390 [Marmoricola sp.]
MPPTGRAGRIWHDLLYGVRRAWLAFALGVVMFLVAIPAVDDLDRLCRALGVALLVLGGVIVAATIGLRTRDAGAPGG